MLFKFYVNYTKFKFTRKVTEGKIIYVKHLQLDTRHLPEMDKLQLIDVGRLIKDKYLHGSRVKNVDNLCLTPAEGRDTSA